MFLNKQRKREQKVMYVHKVSKKKIVENVILELVRDRILLSEEKYHQELLEQKDITSEEYYAYMQNLKENLDECNNLTDVEVYVNEYLAQYENMLYSCFVVEILEEFVCNKLFDQNLDRFVYKAEK